jgi:hypothetical protein
MREPEIRQKVGERRARYEVTNPPADEPDVCMHCGGDIVCVGGRWYALEGSWPNLAHCHHSARSAMSVHHQPRQRGT